MNAEQEQVNAKLNQQLQWCLQMFEILQENNYPVGRRNGSLEWANECLTSSDMTEAPIGRGQTNNDASVDWSSNDGYDGDDDVIIARNIDNNRDGRQRRKIRKQIVDRKQITDRKSMFSLFGKQEKKLKEYESQESVTRTGDFEVDRRPKRYFSQQNLSAVSMDEGAAVVDTYSTPRKFLWRLTSNKKYQSQQDLPRAGVPHPDQLSSSGYKGKTTNLEDHPSRTASIQGQGYEGLGKCNLEQRLLDNKYQSNVSVPLHGNHNLDNRPSWTGSPDSSSSMESTGSHFHQRDSSNRSRNTDFPNVRCLGEYRPRLNTHVEEPAHIETGDTSHHVGSFTSRLKNRWSMQMLGANQQTDRRHQHTGWDSPERERLIASSFTGFPASGIAIPDTSCYPVPQKGSGTQRTGSGTQKTGLPHSTDGLSRTGRVFGGPEQAKRMNYGTPVDFKPQSRDKEDIRYTRNTSTSEPRNTRPVSQRTSDEPRLNQVRAIRQLSQEFYNDYHLFGQRKAVSDADIFTSVKDVKKPTVSSPKGSDTHESYTTGYHPENCIPDVDQHRNEIKFNGYHNRMCSSGVPLHSRSVSLSQLQKSAQSCPRVFTTNSNHHRKTSENIQSGSTSQLTPRREQSYAHNHDIIQKGKGQVVSTHAQQLMGNHQRGVSLDSSDIGGGSGRVPIYPSSTDFRHPGSPSPCSTPHSSSDLLDQEDLGKVVSFRGLNRDVSSRFKPLRSSGEVQVVESGESNRVENMIGFTPPGRLNTERKFTGCSGDGRTLKTAVASTNIKPHPDNTRLYNMGTHGQTCSPLSQTGSDQVSVRCDPGPSFRVDHSISLSSPENVINRRSMGSINGHGSIAKSIFDDQQYNKDRVIGERDRTKQTSISMTLGQQRSTSQCQGRTLNASRTDTTTNTSYPSGFQNSPDPTSSPPPPALPPKTYRLRTSLVTSPDDAGSTDRLLHQFEADGDSYADRLRVEARRLSKPSGSLRSSSAWKRESLGENAEWEMNTSPEQNGVNWSMNERKSILCSTSPEGAIKLRLNESADEVFLDDELSKINGFHTRKKKEDEEKEEKRNEKYEMKIRIENMKTDQDKLDIGSDRKFSFDKKKENTSQENHQDRRSSHQPCLSISALSSVTTKSPSQTNLSSTDNYILTSGLNLQNKKHLNSSIPSFLQDDPDKSSKSLLGHKKEPRDPTTDDVIHNLNDLSKNEVSSSPHEESFRGLSSVLCRHLKGADQELGLALRLVCVKTSAEIVRRVFEGRKLSFQQDPVFQLVTPMRPEVSSKSTMMSKEQETPHGSLQTIKNELLRLAEKSLQSQKERKQHFDEKLEENQLLEKKVTDVVREKTDSKQFEKYLSYLEQLDNVIQLLLNLSSRLSNVDKTLCQIPDNNDEKENTEKKKQFMEKRRRILERLEEAMELKNSIDARSQQVSVYLSEHLSPTEFQEFRTMVRSRCALALQMQAAEDQKDLAVIQKILTDRC